MVVGGGVVRAVDAAARHGQDEQLTGGQRRAQHSRRGGLKSVSPARRDPGRRSSGRCQDDPTHGPHLAGRCVSAGWAQTIVMGRYRCWKTGEIQSWCGVDQWARGHRFAPITFYLGSTPKVHVMHIGGWAPRAETLAGAVAKCLPPSKETSGGKGTVPHGRSWIRQDLFDLQTCVEDEKNLAW